MTLGHRSLERWDEAEFRAVFLDYCARIIGILVPLVDDRSRAEELADDAFWRLVDGIKVAQRLWRPVI